MCGICGVFHYGSDQPADRDEISRMTSQLKHRGPDSSGVWRDGPIGFGHTRLSIIDLAGGAQPMSAPQSSLVVTFNGEIYNHTKIRSELEAAGVTFHTRSDTEVLLQAYARLGPNFLERLNGMFAFAIWDGVEQRLLLVRDRMGIKPLYYYDNGTSVYFASELRALIASGAVPFELSVPSLHQYFCYQYVPAPETIIAGVRKLLPAEVVGFSRRGRPTQQFYWTGNFGPKLQLSNNEASERFLNLLRSSIRRRLVSDVPVGAFLSGGIDSSAIVALMSEIADAPPRTFSIGFQQESYNELDYANAVANRFGTIHHQEVFELSPQLLDDYFDRVDEPMSDVSSIPTFLVSRLAREHVKVVLSGDGSDELLGGYERHLASKLDRFLSHWMVPSFKAKIFRKIIQSLPLTDTKKGSSAMLRKFLEGAVRPPNGRQMRWQSLLGCWSDDVFGSGWQSCRPAWTPYEEIDSILRLSDATDPLDRELSIEQRLYLPNDILTKLDQMSMACGLEARVPFLDHELVEFLNRLPGRQKSGCLRGKKLLRRAVRSQLPKSTLSRRKQGFSMPLRQSLRGELRSQVLDCFASPDSDLGGILRIQPMLDMVAEQEQGRTDNTHHLWSVYVLLQWHRRIRRAVASSSDVVGEAVRC